VLREFNLTVKRGETIALVGPTGAGKSTVVNLICRFFEPRGGALLSADRLHRHDAARDSVADWYGAANAAPVQRHDPRESALRQARCQRREVETAAKLSGAHEFIITLEKGYESQVGEAATCSRSVRSS